LRGQWAKEKHPQEEGKEGLKKVAGEAVWREASGEQNQIHPSH